MRLALNITLSSTWFEIGRIASNELPGSVNYSKPADVSSTAT